MRTKSPRIPRRPLLLAVGIGLFPAWYGLAQDKVTTADGRTQDVKILGATPMTLQVQIGSGNMRIPMNTVAAITMAPPVEFSTGNAAYDAGDYPKALASIRAVVDRFKGLKTGWAEQATSLLGDIYVALNKLPEAEAAYQDLSKTYGEQSAIRTEVGMARVALARNDFDGARRRLEPVTTQALQEKHPAPAIAPAYSQAFYLLGQVLEAQHDYPAALENYLRTVTLFYADRTAVAAAAQKADMLRKDHAVTVP